jgi:hypothetical protein
MHIRVPSVTFLYADLLIDLQVGELTGAQEPRHGPLTIAEFF